MLTGWLETRDWAPTPGTAAWEQEARRYERAVARQRKEARRGPGSGPPRRPRRWLLLSLGLGAVVVALSLVFGRQERDSTGVVAATPTSGPETISENTDHPPQADLNSDTTCAAEPPIDTVVAKGTLTNRSSETSSYSIHVSFNDQAGVRFGEGSTFHRDVRAGESVQWEASGFTSFPGPGWTCEVVSIERFASR